MASSPRFLSAYSVITGLTATAVTVAASTFGLLGIAFHKVPMKTFAVVGDNPYVITALVGTVSFLFGSLTLVSKMLIDRADKAHQAEKETIIAGKDAVIAVLEARCNEFADRADRYEKLTMRLMEAAREATEVATQAVKRGDK